MNVLHIYITEMIYGAKKEGNIDTTTMLISHSNGHENLVPWVILSIT